MDIKWLIKPLVKVVVLCAIAAVVTFALDTYTVPVQQDVALEQLNGGDEEWMIQRTANSSLQTARTIVWPIAVVACIWILSKPIYRKLEETEKGEEQK